MENFTFGDFDNFLKNFKTENVLQILADFLENRKNKNYFQSENYQKLKNFLAAQNEILRNFLTADFLFALCETAKKFDFLAGKNEDLKKFFLQLKLKIKIENEILNLDDENLYEKIAAALQNFDDEKFDDDEFPEIKIGIWSEKNYNNSELGIQIYAKKLENFLQKNENPILRIFAEKTKIFIFSILNKNIGKIPENLLENFWREFFAENENENWEKNIFLQKNVDQILAPILKILSEK